ncbi:MAG: S1-like domain-containing RNA-binding protein [Fimbriimonadaceae bacterium]
MRIGEYQELEVVRDAPQGLYLSDGGTDVLLPASQIPKNVGIGQMLKVFLYTDSEDRPIATCQKPRAVVGEFAVLPVVSVARAGAFFDWGLAKDLFCPFSEQQGELYEGDWALVRVYLDQASQRVVCTTNINKFLQPHGEGLTKGEPIQIMISAIQRDVIHVIINGRIRGAMFPDEWVERFQIGDVRDAFVKDIRETDKKVAVSLRPQGYQAVIGESDRFLKALEANGGFLPVGDRSSPDEIQRRFGLSKGAFKKLIGALYRQGVIDIESHGVRLRALE